MTYIWRLHGNQGPINLQLYRLNLDLKLSQLTKSARPSGVDPAGLPVPEGTCEDAHPAKGGLPRGR